MARAYRASIEECVDVFDLDMLVFDSMVIDVTRDELIRYQKPFFSVRLLYVPEINEAWPGPEKRKEPESVRDLMDY